MNEILDAIGEGQFAVAGQLPTVIQQRYTRLFPVFIGLPEGFPEEHVRLGLAANVTVLTDNAGVVGMVASIAHWVTTTLDYVL